MPSNGNLFEAHEFQTQRGRIVTVAVEQDHLPAGAVIALVDPRTPNPAVPVAFLQVTTPAEQHPRGGCRVRDLDWTTPRHDGDDGVGFFTAEDGRSTLRHRVVEADDPDLARLIDDGP